MFQQGVQGGTAAEPVAAPRRVRVGVIGVGRIGRLHAENLSRHIPRASVAAISDIRREAATAAAEACGVPKRPADHREILKDPEIEEVES